MSSYREQSEKAKAARREPAPEKMALAPDKARKKKPKDTHGVYRVRLKDDTLRALKSLFKPGRPYRTFPSEQAALQWREKYVRSMTFVPKDSEWNIQQLQERERQRWQIKELT